MFAIALLVSTVAFGQKKPQASPRDSVSRTVAGSMIKITYHSPAVKDRKTRRLAPYGKVWGIGVDEVTIFTTSKAIEIANQTLPVGEFNVYITPGKKKWEITFNFHGPQNMGGSATTEYGKFFLQAHVTPKRSKHVSERFKIEINNQGFVLLWDNLAVPVAIK